MSKHLNITIIGLSISSSWGNGHATTFRGLVKGLYLRDHKVTFLERDMPWYASQRDMESSPFCEVLLYNSVPELKEKYHSLIETSDCVIVGSYVPEGIRVGQWVQQTARGMVAFYDIDTPVTLAKLKTGSCDYISNDLIPGYDLYLSFTGGPVLEYLVKELGSPKAEPFYCSFDPDLYYPQNAAVKWDMGYMGTYSDDRQPSLSKLLLEPARSNTNYRFVVAGPLYPADIEWPANVERIEHLPPEKHCEFYNAQRYTLNITRADMIQSGYSPSVRLFEAAGCATLIISDYWAGLETIFIPGEEILIAQNSSDVNNIINTLSESERKNIAICSYMKVLNNHTSGHRAFQLERYLEETAVIKGSRKKIIQM